MILLPQGSMPFAFVDAPAGLETFLKKGFKTSKNFNYKHLQQQVFLYCEIR